MTALVDYVRYNHLLSLGEANISRQTTSVYNIVNGPIRDVFLKYGAHIAHCLYLQHRHHTVGANEAVVRVEGTAHLMGDEAVKDIVSFNS